MLTGGSVVSVTLRIGSQTYSRTSAGLLYIDLSTAGTFTASVSVTDSWGQTTTKEIGSLIVKSRVNPSARIAVTRVVEKNGKYVSDDEGTIAIITMSSIAWDSTVAHFDTPIVSVRDRNNQTATPTITWYSSWALDGTLSNPITWSSFTGNTAYGLIDATYDTQYSYTVSLTPRDLDVKNVGHSGTVVTYVLGSAYYTVDFLAGGHGIAFGQACAEEGFWCNMDVFIGIPQSTTAGTTDKALYDAIVALGWQNDVIV